MKTIFGSTGWILGGTHPKLKCSNLELGVSVAINKLNTQLCRYPLKLTADAASLVTCARLRCIPDIVIENIGEEVDRKVTALKVTAQPMLTPEFWEKDSLGVLPPRRC